MPERGLELSFVNGLNAYELSQMAFYEGEANIVYPAALLGIRMDKNTLEQAHLGGGSFEHSRNYHTDDIVALDYVESLGIAASGSLGKNPEVCLWRPSDMELLLKFRQGKDTRAASCVRLSRDGKFVFTTCKSNKPALRAFCAETGALLAEQKIEGAAIQMAAGDDGMLAVASPRCT